MTSPQSTVGSRQLSEMNDAQFAMIIGVAQSGAKKSFLDIHSHTLSLSIW